MYTILLDDDKSLVCVKRETIMQRSKLADKLVFLVPEVIEDYDMSGFEAVLEYVLPQSGKYRTKLLSRSEGLFEGKYYRYAVDADTELTAENGEVRLQLSFAGVIPDRGGVKNVVFKTKPCSVVITALEDWAQYVPDESLTELDRRISDLAAAQGSITAVQEELARMRGSIIDDDNISKTTTYSSEKLERLHTEKSGVFNGEIDGLFGDNDSGGEADKMNKDIDGLFEGDINSDIDDLF